MGPQIHKNLFKQFKSKNIKVKVATMKTYADLSNLKETPQFLSQIMPYIQSSVKESNNDLIIHSLAVLKQAFRN